MSPVQPPRQLLVWSLPTVAVLLGLLWYKRRRTASAPSLYTSVVASSHDTTVSTVTADTSIATNTPDISPVRATPDRSPDTRPSCSRSLSGHDASAPIDIKCARSAPIHMSDTELDLEIERMKLAKGQVLAAAPPLSPVPRPSAPHTPDRDSANHSPCCERLPPVLSPSLSAGSPDHSDSDSGKGGSDVATPPPRPKQQPVATPPPPQQPKPAQTKQQKTSAQKKQNKKLSKKQRRNQKFHPIESIEKFEEKTSARLEENTKVVKSAADSSVNVDNIKEVDEERIIYEFAIPQTLVGRLIGKHGAFVHEILNKTGASVLVKKHPIEGPAAKVCSLEGTTSAVEDALAMIRARFPLKRNPELTMQRIAFTPIVPEYMYLRLIEGINNDTMVSYIETPAHLFVQQPTHPSFPTLAVLSSCMQDSYGGAEIAPALPWPAPVGTVCAARDSEGNWHRASVISATENSATVIMLDFGGFLDVEETALRQIRADFVTLPFQASQCYLADIGPPGDDGQWSQEAYDAVAEITGGTIVYTQILDYAEDGVPLVRVYVPVPGRRTTLLLNNELVDRGLAQRLAPISC